MKKIAFIAAFALATASSYGEGFNVGLNFGYGMPAGTSTVGITQTTNTQEIVKGSFGAGLNFGLNLNYMFSDNLGADLGFSYLMGKEFSSSTEPAPGFNLTQDQKGSMVRIMPGVRVCAGEGKSVMPYGRFGLVVGAGSKIEESNIVSGFGGKTIYKYEYSGGPSIGWYGAFGLGFDISDNLKLTTEVNMINQTWAPEKYRNVNNSDASPLDDEITFDDKVSDTDTNKELKWYSPFGSVGVNVGLEMGF